jgi:hypothetical protein
MRSELTCIRHRDDTTAQARTENIERDFRGSTFRFLQEGNMDDQSREPEFLFNRVLAEIEKDGACSDDFRRTLEVNLQMSKQTFDEMWPLLNSPEQVERLKADLQNYRENTVRRRRIRRRFGELGRLKLRYAAASESNRPLTDAILGRREFPKPEELPPAFDFSQVEAVEDHEDRLIKKVLHEMHKKVWPLRQLVIEPFIGFLHWNGMLDRVDLTRHALWDALFDWHGVPRTRRYTPTGVQKIVGQIRKLPPPSARMWLTWKDGEPKR